MKAEKLAFFVVVLAILPGCVQPQKEEKGFSLAEKAIVARAVDGDTILLSNKERVRLIGIDAPEKGQKCFEEAKNRLQDMVSGKRVLLLKDVSDRDKYGRLVRYVFVNGMFANQAMVEEGHAKSYEFEPDTKFRNVFEKAELEAMDDNGCLWKERV